MAEIVLIQPYTGTWDEMSVRPPESLLAVAAVPYAKGYDVKIVDQRLSKNLLPYRYRYGFLYLKAP